MALSRHDGFSVLGPVVSFGLARSARQKSTNPSMSLGGRALDVAKNRPPAPSVCTRGIEGESLK